MPKSGIAGLVATIIVGGAVGAAAVVGVVSSQTGPPDTSPANVNQPFTEYGS